MTAHTIKQYHVRIADRTVSIIGDKSIAEKIASEYKNIGIDNAKIVAVFITKEI